MDWEHYRRYTRLRDVRARIHEIEAAQHKLHERMKSLLNEFRTTFARSRPWEVHPYIHCRDQGMRHWMWRLKGHRGKGQNYVHLFDERVKPILDATPAETRKIWLAMDKEGRAASLLHNRLGYELRWLRIQDHYLVDWKRIMREAG